jgi:hypothetical protein
MLLSKLSSTTRINIFGEFCTTHISLGSSCTSSRGQTNRFHTLEFVQGIEADLDEHRRVVTMFYK